TGWWRRSGSRAARRRASRGRLPPGPRERAARRARRASADLHPRKDRSAPRSWSDVLFQPRLGLVARLRVADVHPVAVQHAAEEATLGGRGAPQGAERERTVGASVGVIRPGDVDAHIGVGCAGGLASESQGAVLAEEEIAAAL